MAVLPQPSSASSPRRVGRYLIDGPIASGGMATVHFGALVGEAGFSRTVAVKRLRTDMRNRELESALIDEARLVSRIKHPNVVPILDVVRDGSELLVILEYVVGESLSRLLKRTEKAGMVTPMRLAVTIMINVLLGLHAAHDAKSPRGKPLGIVHRDVSPQNIMVGADGLARVLDFGIATATERLSRSVAGQIKGKLGYMAPEQFRGVADRRTDIYAAAVVLWEVLAHRRLFHGVDSGEVIDKVLNLEVPPPSHYQPAVPRELDEVVMRALAREPEARYASARHFAAALEGCMGLASPTEIGVWVQQVAGEALSQRAVQVAALERSTSDHAGPQIVVRDSRSAATTVPVRGQVGIDLTDIAAGGPPTTVAAARPAGAATATGAAASAGPTQRAPAAVSSQATTRRHAAGAPGEGPAAGAGGTEEAVTLATRLSPGALPPSDAPPGAATQISPVGLNAARDQASDVVRRDGAGGVGPALSAPLARDPVDPPPARRRSLPWVAVVLLLGLVVVVLWRGLKMGQPDSTPAALPLGSDVSRVAGPASALPPASVVAASTAEPGGAEGVAVSAATPSSPAVAATARSSASARRPAPKAHGGAGRGVPAGHPPTGGPSHTGADCDPPFTVDSRGIRSLKPECM